MGGVLVLPLSVESAQQRADVSYPRLRLENGGAEDAAPGAQGTGALVHIRSTLRRAVSCILPTVENRVWDASAAQAAAAVAHFGYGESR